MNNSEQPTRITTPWAYSGTKRTIPETSQIGVTPGAASWPDGFPPLTFAPLASGGVPPAGSDFNGVLNAITAIQKWQSAGGMFHYDATYSAAIGGYPKGAVLSNLAADGVWLNLTDANTTNPDATNGSSLGWQAINAYGLTAIALSNANITLTPAQSGKKTIALAGVLTANIQLTFPKTTQEWSVINDTTGAFTVSALCAAGTPVVCVQNTVTQLQGTGTNVVVAALNLVAGSTMAEPTSSDNSAKVINSRWAKLGFASTIAATGSLSLPTWLGGLIIKWGLTGAIAPAGSQIMTFATPFPNNAFGAVFGVAGGTAGTAEYTALGTASITIANGLAGSASNPIFYLVLGN